jgi:hypothetical protein
VRTKSQIIALVLFFGVLLTVGTTLTPPPASEHPEVVVPKVGVEVGDTAEYLIHEIWNYYEADYSTGVPIYSYYNVTGRFEGFQIHLSVAGIEGAKVTLNLTLCYPNGTWYQGLAVVVDVSSGACEWTSAGYSGIAWRPMDHPLIVSDLEPGDPIYSGSSIIIGESLNMSVGGEDRIVNHVLLGEFLPWGVQYYWDKSSGLLLEHDYPSVRLLDGINWSETELHWLNVSSVPPMQRAQLSGGNPIDTAGGTTQLLTGSATAVALNTRYILSDRGRRR